MPQMVEPNRKESFAEYDPARDRVPGKAERAQMLYLPDEIARKSLPAVPLGQHLWMMSGQVQPDSLFKGFSGRYGRTDVVYFKRNGKQFIKPYSAPRDPKSQRQVDQRERFSAARRQWRSLTCEQRAAWEVFAWKNHPVYRNCVPVADDMQTPGRVLYTERGELRMNLAQVGLNLFTSCQMQRMTRGDAMRAEAPSRRRPGGVWQIHEVASPAGTYAFRIEHAERNMQGMKVMLEMSPAAKSPAHKPMEKYMTRAGATDPGSFFELGNPDTVYVLEAPRHTIAAGQRYLVRAAILTDDGLKGMSFEVDLIRQEPGELGEPEAGASRRAIGNPRKSTEQLVAESSESPAAGFLAATDLAKANAEYFRRRVFKSPSG